MLHLTLVAALFPGPASLHGPLISPTRELYRPACVAGACAGSRRAARAANHAPVPQPWGPNGHAITGWAAAMTLPEAMPAFFRGAAAQLAYLNYDPDRWRERRFPEMDRASAWEHYIDLEVVPPEAFQAEDRFAYLRALEATELAEPARDAGLLPFRILELVQRLTKEFSLWRKASDPAERPWIEERIVNDAGILGHYVADAANPQHTTVHHNGWADGYANPQGFTTERTFHRRFETDFVKAHITLDDVLPRLTPGTSEIRDARAAILGLIRDSHAQVPRLYQLEREFGFAADRAAPQTRAFAAERLAASARMLRDLWWSAWLRSAAIG
ncbi:MAG: hypothetical protein HY704_01290 [Gemmatimonadetes bacterium]|nr:hypothetical protein [Gemmatimonadota bacterium]